METLERVARAHREQLAPALATLHRLAESTDLVALDARPGELRVLHRQLTDVLLPHLEAVEMAVHPALDRLPGHPPSTGVLAKEHEEIRRLVVSVGLAGSAQGGLGSGLEIRRTLQRLDGLLATHLAAEERYLNMLERELPAGQRAVLARALDHVVERL